MRKKILCMGSINMDLVMYADHLPIPGETVLTDNFHTFPGGKGGNQSVATSKLGGDVSYFTKLGTDAFSTQLIQEQIANGVSMSHVINEDGNTAGIAMIMVDAKGQNCILFTAGANAALSAMDVQEHASIFDEYDILQITMELQTETVYKAIKIAKSKGMIVVLDPAPAPAARIPREIAELVDYVKPNETEAEILTGVKILDQSSAERALEELVALGFKTPMISLSDKGLLTVDGTDKLFVQSLSVKPVDTTAAGDIFLGGFVASLSLGRPFRECLEFAKTAAAISVTRRGAQTSIPTLLEVENAMNQGVAL
jgi:ribokinase